MILSFAHLSLALFILLSGANAYSNDYTTTTPYTATFARNQHITFPKGTKVYTYLPGKSEYEISSAVVVEPMKPVTWMRPDGKVLTLECGVHPRTPMSPQPRGRVVTFHENGEYKSGCSSYGKHDFQKKNAFITTQHDALLNLDNQGSLVYTNRVIQSQVIIEGQEVELAAHSEVNFYNGESVDFFTPKEETSLQVTTDIGTLKLKQNKQNPAYFRFSKDGHLLRAILEQSLQLGKILIKEGAGVSFAKDEQSQQYLIDFAVLPDFVQVETQDQYVLKTKHLRFYPSGNILAALTAKDFMFLNPETQEILYVPAPSQIYLDEAGVIMSIQIGTQNQ